MAHPTCSETRKAASAIYAGAGARPAAPCQCWLLLVPACQVQQHVRDKGKKREGRKVKTSKERREEGREERQKGGKCAISSI